MEKMVVCFHVKSFITNLSLHDSWGPGFVINVVITNLTREMVFASVISWLVSVAMELNAIVNIHKYKGFHEGHHFILMAMEVQRTLEHDMDCFIRERACFFPQ